MYLKYWIETCLKEKGWTLAKLQAEIETAETTRIQLEYDKKLAKITSENKSEEAKKIKTDLLNLEFKEYFKKDDNDIISYDFITAGIGMATLSRIRNSESYFPSSNTIKKIEVVLGSFEDFIARNSNRKIMKGACREEALSPEKIKSKKMGGCIFCGGNFTGGSALTISTHKKKLPIAEKLPKNASKDKSKLLRFNICKKCYENSNFIISNSYSDLLLYLKTSYDCTQAYLAKLLGVSPSYLFKIINEKIDYINPFLAYNIHILAAREVNAHSLGINMNELKENLTQDINNLYLNPGNYWLSANDTIRFKNRYEIISLPKVRIEEDYKINSSITTRHLRSKGSVSASCDFAVKVSNYRFEMKKIEPARCYEEKIDIAGFIYHGSYFQGIEYSFLHLIKIMGLRYICIIAKPSILEKRYETPLNYTYFFEYSRMKLNRVSVKEIFLFR